MIQIKRVVLKNFFSIGEAALNLDEPGAYLVTAAPAKRGAFSSNGVGKTSLFEGLVWCLYGRTIRDLPFDDALIRNKAARAEVTVDLDVDGKSYLITRTKRLGKSVELRIYDKKKANHSEVDGRPKEECQAFIGTVNELNKAIAEKLLGCSFDVFVNAVYFPQGRFAFFTQANDKEKKEIFDNILGTSYLTGLQESVKAKCTELKWGIDAAQTGIDKDLAQVEFVSHSLDKLGEEDLENEKSLAAVPDKVFTVTEENENALRKAKESHERAREQLMEAQASIKKRAADMSALSKSISDVGAKLSRVTLRRQRLEKELAGYKEMIAAGSCPTCFQKFIDQASMDQALADQEQEVNEAAYEEEGFKKEIDALRQDFDVLRLSEPPDEQRLKGLVNARRFDVESIEDEMARIRDAAAKRHLAIQAYEYRKKSIATRRGELSDGIAKLNTSIDKRKLDLSKMEDDLRYYEFWVEGFGGKGLKSLMFENLMPFITERANYYSGILTDGTVAISISPTTELKSGESREKISVTAVNQEGSSIYEGQSGGERKRVDLCILLALQDLLVSRSGKAIKFSIYDELLDECDSEGIERVVQLLKERGQSQPVFVISHSEELKAHFEERVELVKENGITRIEHGIDA